MKVEFFTDTIHKDVSNFDLETQDHVAHLMDLLEVYGAAIRMPYSKSLGDGVFELRALGKTHVRLLYCFYRGSAIILHIFAKKQNKASNNDILIAKNRKKQLLA